MAFRLSDNLVGVLNAVALLLSVPVLGAGIWLGARGADYCAEREIYPSAPVVAFLTFISLAGLVGRACRRVTCLLRFYLCAMFILTALLFCFTVFAFVITNKGAAGESASGRGYKENWPQMRLENSKNWNQDSKTLQAKKWTQDQFFHADLFSLEHRLPTNGSFNCHHMLSQSASGIFAAAAAGKLNHIAVVQPELSNLPFDPTVQFIALMILTVQAAGRRLHKKNKSPRGKGTAAAALLVLLAVAALPDGAVAARPLHGGGGEHVVQAASGPVAAAPPPAMMMPKSLASSGRSSCTNDPNTMGTGRPCIHQ